MQLTDKGQPQGTAKGRSFKAAAFFLEVVASVYAFSENAIGIEGVVQEGREEAGSLIENTTETSLWVAAHPSPMRAWY